MHTVRPERDNKRKAQGRAKRHPRETIGHMDAGALQAQKRNSCKLFSGLSQGGNLKKNKTNNRITAFYAFAPVARQHIYILSSQGTASLCPGLCAHWASGPLKCCSLFHILASINNLGKGQNSVPELYANIMNLRFTTCWFFSCNLHQNDVFHTRSKIKKHKYPFCLVFYLYLCKVNYDVKS